MSKLRPVNHKNRLNREEYWKETLQTSYPDGLNERKGKAYPHLPVEYSFPLIQGQDKDLPDVAITSVLTTLKSWNLYITVCITILQMILTILTGTNCVFLNSIQVMFMKENQWKFWTFSILELWNRFSGKRKRFSKNGVQFFSWKH